jgi:hypothetical protein
MRALPILLILQLVVLALYAQRPAGTISGRIEDADGKAMDAVSVSLLKGRDSVPERSVGTDANGQFIFENVSPGKYRLSVSHIGYMAWSSPTLELTEVKPSLSVNVVRLQPAAGASLGQVTVVGRRPLIENKIDKTVVNVDASTTNGGLTALEVLEKSPGVTVDNDGKISLRGKAGVIVMIDGKPTYLYFKSPNNFNFNWRQGKFNVYGNYGYAWWEGFNDVHGDNSQRQNAGAAFDRYSQQHTYGRYSDRGHSFRAGVDYFADKNTTLGFGVNGTVDRQWFTSGSTTDFYDSLHNFVQYNIAQSLNKTPQTHVGFNGNFVRKLDSKGSELSVDADYIFYNTQGTVVSNNYLYNSDKRPSDDPYLLNGQLPSLIHIYSLKSDYKKVFKNNATFEAGVKSSYVKTDNNAIYSLYDNTLKSFQPDTSISNHFIYKENINAAYVNWRQTIKKFSMQVGLRAEQTHSEGDQTVKDIRFKRDYIQLFPTTYLTYKSNDDNTFGISYGRRIERPSYQDLNPFRFQLDRYTYEEGNPNLQPQFSNNFEVSYNYKGQLNISANYTRVTDIMSYVQVTFKEPGDSNYTTVSTNRNIAVERNFGLSINYSRQLNKSWTLNVFFNLYNHRYTGVVDSTPVDVSYTSFNANFNSQYSFKKGWKVEASGFYYAQDYISGVLLADGRGMFSLGGSKEVLNGKGSFKLNLRDPFYLMSFNSHSSLARGVINSRSIWDNRRIVMTFVYRFGKTTGGQQQRRNGGAGDEQSRVGGGGQQ